MKAFCRFRLICAFVLGFFAVVLLPAGVAFAEEQDSANNRFNVVMVVDASGSMKDTDPNELRFDAIDQFVTLLAERGNSLGGVVFTEHVVEDRDEKLKLAPVNSLDEKRQVKEALESVEAKGDTNIGEALSTAMDMLQTDGNQALPSVILLLSDGNTDLPTFTDEEVQESLDKKAEAVQRAREEGVHIYSVCLNVDGKADCSEMKWISDSTDGEMIEVKRAEDLQEVFNKFYSFIFGTSTEPIFTGLFPQNGKLEDVHFDIPALGVEEVNIVLYGNDIKYSVLKPRTDKKKEEAEYKKVEASTFTLLKITDVVPGRWTLKTEGEPGAPIKINMVFNSNLGVRVDVKPKKEMYHPDDEITVRAYLSQAGVEAASVKQYEGYTAELQVFNALDNQKIDTLPMKLGKNSFELKRKYAEGTYRFVVHVTGNYLERSSNMTEPYMVSASATSEEKLHNTPPEPVTNPVEDTVVVWPSWSPVGDKTYERDLATLATDQQDETLDYYIVDTSFGEGDYTRDGDKLTVTNFSTSKGDFIIRAADHLEDTCDITVIVNSHDVGFYTLVLTMILLVVLGVVLLYLLYRAITMFPRGTVSVHSNVNGAYSGENNIGWRGRLFLSRCGLDPVGLNYRKSYIQATGKRYAVLKTNRPVMYGGKPTRKVRLDSHNTVFVNVDEGKSLELRFESAMDRNPSAFSESSKGFKPRKARGFRKAPRRWHK